MNDNIINNTFEEHNEIYELLFELISEADDEQLQNMQNALQQEIDRREGKTTPPPFGMANNPYWNCQD